jgi:hypothetical protein
MDNSKIHLRADYADGTHTKFTVFCNGANCGQLCMTQEEAIYFHHIVMLSKYLRHAEVKSSGKWTKEE